MFTPTNLRIALVHLTSRGKQTAIAVLSVVFGVSTYVFMNGFMDGVNDTQTDLAFSTLAHVRISNDASRRERPEPIQLASTDTLFVVRNARSAQRPTGIRNSGAVMRSIRDVEAITAVAPQVNMTVVFSRGATRIEGRMSGIDPDQEDRVFGISEYIVKGRWDDLGRRTNGMVLGKTLAENLGVRMNDRVRISTLEGQSQAFQVVGILEVGVTSVDAQKAFISIGAARRMLATNASFVTDLQLALADYGQARVVEEQLATVVPYTVESWQTASGQLEVANGLRNIIALAVSVSLLIVAGFGIYNIMTMTVHERIRQIAILMAMGFGRSDIVAVFLVQSLVIGVLGGLAGVAAGFGMSVFLDHRPFPLAALDTYPITYSPADYVASFFGGLLTTFLAGFLPAWKASRVDPVQILRG
jgi:lipoprotein-releasing system permease protein